MKRFFTAILIIAAFLAPGAAQAAEAWSTAKVNLRAGPDGGYPVVETLKRNERVELLGCLAGYQWCEVETRQGERGWVYAHYLNTNHNGRAYTIIQSNGAGGLRIITFKPRNYWDTYYRNKYFYKNRDRWLPREHHHHDRDDDDNGHGYHGGRPERPAKPPEVKEEPKYGPSPMSSRKKYNPLCDIGETEC